MKISQLYVYPIKSLRGTALTESVISKTGLLYDREFMLLRVEDATTTPPTLKNMHVTHYPQMTLFHTKVISMGNDVGDKVTVTYTPPGDASSDNCITIPLRPDVAGLADLSIEMHSSSTKALNMGPIYNNWFSSCFGFDVILVYIDKHRRPVLGSFSPSATNTLPNKGTSLFSRLNFLPQLGLGGATEEEGITFSDCAAFLVVNDKSVENASARLPGEEEMDITKFRSNIVVSGANEAWEEDFWAEIAISSSTEAGVDPVNIALTQNCVRCKSINIDYATGKPGTGEAGSMLKKLMKDRRVDQGAKYSPVFGRYGYLTRGLGTKIKVGDDLMVVKQLVERTTFDWPGIGN